jgi:hypothetical protein
LRIRLGIGSVVGTATVSALGGLINSANAQVNAFATVSASPNAIYSAFAYVEGIGAVTAKGTILGEEWLPVPVGIEAWTPVTVGTETWSEISPSTDIWTLENNPSYVNSGYFVIGYIEDDENFNSTEWTTVTPSNEQWLRQG